MSARTHLVAYDVRAPRRLQRVHKALSEVGFALQYSVFAVDLEDWERSNLIAGLRGLIDEKQDDVRFYLVPSPPRGAWYGPLPGNSAVAVSGAPAATLAERLARRQAVIDPPGPTEV